MKKLTLEQASELASEMLGQALDIENFEMTIVGTTAGERLGQQDSYGKVTRLDLRIRGLVYD